MAKGKNYKGQQFGCLIPLEPTEKRDSNGSIIWKCKCIKCNNEIMMSSKNFTRKLKECSNCKITSELNKTYGKLTVKKYIASEENGIHWLCECSCGNNKIVTTSQLHSNHVQSCGCLQREKAQNKTIDMTGRTIGRWKVLSKSKTRNSSRSVKWLCECSCDQHTQKEISGTELRRGTTLSCGCLRMSHGEYQIAHLLTQANIPYETEKKFSDCILPSGLQARFDFYVNNTYLIEFDGIQHYQEMNTNYFKNNLKENQRRDEIKNQWCIDNNIKLIRIPYTHLNKIKLEDLLLETSKFILT